MAGRVEDTKSFWEPDVQWHARSTTIYLLWIRYTVDWGHGALGALSGIGAALAALDVLLLLCMSQRNDPRHANLLWFAAGGAVLLVSAVGFDLLVGKGTFTTSCAAPPPASHRGRQCTTW
jgi:hypothetical protein